MSGDLRAAVEGLPTWHTGDLPRDLVRRERVLALIPEGAVLVTEETLDAAIHASHFHGRQMAMTDAEADAWLAAAMLRHLREGT